jgi:hypothetical protein
MCLAFTVCIVTPGVSQTSSYSELQAAYLYNFAKYITWPGESSEFTIAILGSEEALKNIERKLKDKKVVGKLLVLKLIATDDTLDAVNIVFLPEDASRELPKLVELARSKNVLIVTEEDLIKKGAGISFVVQDDKLRFKLKKKILDDTGLVVSDGLMRLAIIQ